jgi:hypothetical protein
MWEPERLTTLWVSTGCYRGRFTLFVYNGDVLFLGGRNQIFNCSCASAVRIRPSGLCQFRIDFWNNLLRTFGTTPWKEYQPVLTRDRMRTEEAGYTGTPRLGFEHNIQVMTRATTVRSSGSLSKDATGVYLLTNDLNWAVFHTAERQLTSSLGQMKTLCEKKP